jgi:hypothetical protein
MKELRVYFRASSVSDFATRRTDVVGSGMAARLFNVGRDTLLLLLPNMREWVPEGHLVHFILDAVG